MNQGNENQPQGQAGTLVADFENAIRCDMEIGRDNRYEVMEKRADLIVALTVPAPKDPDDEFTRDQIYIALLPAAVAKGLQSERTPMMAFLDEAWRNAGLAMAARKGGT